MPLQPIVDFEKIDLSRDIFGPEEIRSVCRQRGRLAMVDGILHFEEQGNLIVGYKDIRNDDWWVPDHIPGRPIFPGVLMIEGCAQLCSFHFVKRNPEFDLGNLFIGYGGLDKVRFRAAIEPEARFVMAAKVKRMHRKMFTYQAQGFVDRRLVFETEVMGVIV